mmetsp:Transcript_30702/g.100223  ORF Transcript_30702/g.100223 Transcript_30702/m.100223 type:complete len:227 (-) Transcript_30702:14-694(-)
MLPIRHLHREDAKVRADPAVRSKAGQLPLRVCQDVRGRACDKQQQRGEGARRRQLAAEEEVVEERDDDGAAGAEDDEGLDVAVLQRLHVAVDGAHKHARVRDVRPHLLPLKPIDGGEAAGAEEEAEEGADGELYRRDEGRSRNRVDAQLVDDEQRAGSGGEAERRKNRLAALEGAAEHPEARGGRLGSVAAVGRGGSERALVSTVAVGKIVGKYEADSALARRVER